MLLRKLTIKAKFYIVIVLIVSSFALTGLMTYILVSQSLKVGNAAMQLTLINAKFNAMKFAENEFLMGYEEDIDFFATGKSEKLEVFKGEYAEVLLIINSAKENKAAREFITIAELNGMENSLTTYKEKYEELLLKIRERGIDNYGLKARVDESMTELLNSSTDETIKQYLEKLIQNQTLYLKTKDKISYNRFLETFEELRIYLVGDDVALDELNTFTDTQATATTLSTTPTLNTSSPKPALTTQTTSKPTLESTISDEVTDSLKLQNFAASLQSSIVDVSFLDKLQQYQDYFVLLVSVDREIGSGTDKGLLGAINSEKVRLQKVIAVLFENIMPVIFSLVISRIISLLIFILVIIFAVGIIIIAISKSILAPIQNIREYISVLSMGQIPENKIEVLAKDEIAQIEIILNRYIDGLSRTTQFAQAIGKNDFDAEFTTLSENDVLGNSLLEMRNSLKIAKQEEEKRKELDEKQNWITRGISKFNDILRQNNDNVEELSYQIICSLVDYLNANQGGIFLNNDDKKDDNYLEMIAAYAFDRRKYIEKKVYLGEGLVGTCALERKTIFLTKIPDKYIKITSGLGQSNPRSLVLVPLLMEEQVMGVLELASFNEFAKHEIEFIEKVAETIASTLASVKINARTNALLDESKLKSEAMAAQEEEMRQNMEELQATQEEMMRKQSEVEDAYTKLKKNEDIMRKALENNKKVEDELRRKNKEATEKEKEMVKNIDELNHFKTTNEQKQKELEVANQKAKSNEDVLKKALERAKEKEKNLKDIQVKVSEYESRINELTQKLQATQELLKFKDDEIRRLRGE